MVRKVVIGVVVLLLVAGLGLFVWARSVLGQDSVRAALAEQLSRAIGQPVTVEGVSATIYPRVTVTLTGVSIGEPARIRVTALDVGTDLRALLSRRIEHAALHLNGARLDLPLPPMTLASADTGAETSAAPVQLVSVDEVVLNGIELVSRGRTVRGDVDVVPHGTSALTIRRIALVADQAAINGTGEITNMAGPVGTIDLEAGALDLDQLMAFATDFVEGSGTAGSTSAPTPSSPAPPASSPMDLTITMAADRATMAGLQMDKVAAKARLTPEALTLDPVSFNLFDGTYNGSLGATLAGQPTFTWRANLSNVDMGAVTTFAGNPGALTGRLAAQVNLSGQGADAATAMKTVRGTATVKVANGVVKNLALVRSAVAATSLNPQAVIDAGTGPQDEPFSELGASLAIAGGAASTQDLHFVSRDIRLDAAGAFKLDGSVANLTGQVQMSEELSKQAAPVFVRLTQENGRITLPATVRAMNGRFSVSLDTAGIAKRALRNEVEGKAQDAIKRGLGGLLRR